MTSTSPHGFMKSHKLCFVADRVESRPDAFDNWLKDSRHWEYTLSNPNHAVKGYFSQGSAHTQAPTDTEVLQCLAMDARSADDCVDVLDFADEWGYELDTSSSRHRARKVYAACVQTAKDLKELLGEEGYQELLELEFDD